MYFYVHLILCVCIYIYSHCPALGVYLGTSIGGRNASSLPRGVPGMSKMFAVSKLWAMERQPFVHTWWLIPVSKWIITPVISGISRVNLPITGVISRLLSRMSHQVLKRFFSAHKSNHLFVQIGMSQPWILRAVTQALRLICSMLAGVCRIPSALNRNSLTLW